MKGAGTLLLRQSEVARLLSLDDCIAAVEDAFRQRGEGKAGPQGALALHCDGGGFHVKIAMDANRAYVAAKLNGNFPGNRECRGLPAIQGVIVLCDANDGSPLAMMDSIAITTLRTGAATAVAARRMARANSAVASICGCGNQGRVQLRAIARVLPIARAYAFDRDPDVCAGFAREMAAELGMEVSACASLDAALAASDVCITCTPAKRYFILREAVRRGTFIAAVGADHPAKQELQPELLATARLVVDDAMQCSAMGELHHAIEKGLISADGPRVELAEVVAGKKSGRASDDEITIFDSTGVALEDVAAAAIVYQRALAAGAGCRIALAE